MVRWLETQQCRICSHQQYSSCGVEDVALIEFASATERPFMIRMLELNFEPYKSFDHASIRIEYSFMDVTKVVRGAKRVLHCQDDQRDQGKCLHLAADGTATIF